MSKNARFEKVYSQKRMTPLLDRDGKPIISPIVNG